MGDPSAWTDDSLTAEWGAQRVARSADLDLPIDQSRQDRVSISTDSPPISVLLLGGELRWFYCDYRRRRR